MAGLKVDGMLFPEGTSELEAHLFLFSRTTDYWNPTPDKRMEHLVASIDLAYNCKNSIRRVIWNDWTETILQDCIGDWRNKNFVGFAGCSSSGKSDSVALYGMMEYWARPTDTYFVVMSTTKQDARMRIWKSITQFWGQAMEMGCPGKLIDSEGYIKGIDSRGRLWRNSGIVLKAAGQADADEAAKELLGIKNPNVIAAADEFNELAAGILNVAWENLTSNERLKFFGMANPDKVTDPFGDLCEPIKGWKSITEADESWLTKYGKCRRFIAEKSPRILHPELIDSNGVHKYFWQPDQEYCDRIAERRGGRNSKGYYRFVRAFWCPDGASNAIYSEAEFINSCALDNREPQWDSTPTAIISLDPSFSRNGDRSQVAVGKLGKVDGRAHLHVCYETAIQEDISETETPLTHQVVRKWMSIGKDYGVKPSCAIMDNTGAGTPLGHVADLEWSPAIQKVNFQGRSSDRKVVFRNEDVGFYNKNSELWIQPKEFIRGNQISGISKETMSELIEREYPEKEGRTLRVESKEQAKKRMGKSPDAADAFLLLVEKAVTMGILRSEEQKKVAKTAIRGWSKVKNVKSMTTITGRKMKFGRRR
jgi:hypothetical protein